MKNGRSRARRAWLCSASLRPALSLALDLIPVLVAAVLLEEQLGVAFLLIGFIAFYLLLIVAFSNTRAGAVACLWMLAAIALNVVLRSK